MKKIILTLTAILAITTPALSHSKAEDTSPASGATVKIVEAIELRFDHPMRVTAIKLTGPDGELEVIRENGLDPVTEFRAKPPENMPAGAYTVDWRGLSSDGHPMRGTFEFTVAD